MHVLAPWLVALPALLGFGLAMGFNPALYGAAADILARNAQVLPRMSCLVGGLAAGATVLFLLLQGFDPASLVATVRGDVDAALVRRSVDLIAGGVFLAAALPVVWWRIRVPTRPARPARAPRENARLVSYVTLGLSCAFIGFTTWPIMYLTGRVVAGLSPDPMLRLLAYGVFLVALIGPFLALTWVWSRFPQLSTRITRSYTAVVHRDYRWAFAVLLVLTGLVLLGLGLFAGR